MSKAWRKLGQLYTTVASGRHPKLLSHAANPLPIQLEGNIYRIFYSGRDAHNRSSIGAVDIDIVRQLVIQDHPDPFFIHGPAGSFYADGVSIGNCYSIGNKTYMLFMGWQAPAGQHWRGDIGRLVVNPDLTLRIADSKPFMASDEQDAISLSYPWVIKNEGIGYSMWYGSTRTWDAGNGEMLHVINAASSTDGEQWTRLGLALQYEIGVAQAFSRPSVIRNRSGDLDMWFSYRSGSGDTYRIGHAHSLDGISWELHLTSNSISISAEGWDAEMVEYPFVFDHAGRRYMLYNGNGFGKTGFGLAVQE